MHPPTGIGMPRINQAGTPAVAMILVVAATIAVQSIIRVLAIVLVAAAILVAVVAVTVAQVIVGKGMVLGLDQAGTPVSALKSPQ